MYSPDHKLRTLGDDENRSGTHNQKIGGSNPSPATLNNKRPLGRFIVEY